MSSYTRWYRYGTITVSNGSKTVTGVKTFWATSGCNPGDIVKINGVDYELDSITDNTTLTLRTKYLGETIVNGQYAIVRNFNATPMSRIAAQVSEILYIHQTLLDKELTTITGKSAYEVAVDNGFAGTEEEWLESLKAAGEWAELSQEVQQKADKTDLETLNTEVQSKADKTDLENKADKTELDLKADKTSVDPVVEFFNESGFYFDEDGDIAQQLDDDPDPEPDPDPPIDPERIATEGEVNEMLDEIFGDNT